MADQTDIWSWLREFYGQLQPETVDLFGRLMASESCLIHGDGLLLELFGTSNMDRTHGGSYLHLAYLFERVLQNYADRGGNYRLVFFSCLAPLYNFHPALRLARNLLMNHARTNLPGPEVLVMDNWWCQEWEDFLNYLKPSFVLLNDGEEAGLYFDSPEDASAQLPGRDKKRAEAMAFIHRAFLVRCISLQTHCVYTMDVISKDFKLYGYAVEESPQRSLRARQRLGELQDTVKTILEQLSANQPAALAPVPQPAADVPLRQLMIHALAGVPADVPLRLSFVKVSIVHAVLKETLPIHHRAHNLVATSEPMYEQTPLQQLPYFLNCLASSLASLVPVEHLGQGSGSALPWLAKQLPIVDILDPRLVHKLVQLQCCTDIDLLETLPVDILRVVENMWQEFCTLASVADKNLKPLLDADCMSPEDRNSLLSMSPVKHVLPEPGPSKSMLSLSSPLVDMLCDQSGCAESLNPPGQTAPQTASPPPAPQIAKWQVQEQLQQVDIFSLIRYDAKGRTKEAQDFFNSIHALAVSLGGDQINFLHNQEILTTGSKKDKQKDGAGKLAQQEEKKKGGNTGGNKKGGGKMTAAEMIAKNKANKSKKQEEKDQNQLNQLKKQESAAERLEVLKKCKDPVTKGKVHMGYLEALWKEWVASLEKQKGAKSAETDTKKAQDLFHGIYDLTNKFLAQPDSEAEHQMLQQADLERVAQLLRGLGFRSNANQFAKVMRDRKQIVLTKKTDIPLGGEIPGKIDAARFQLMYMGARFDRKEADAKPDSRVPFIPDKWQKKVLDYVDRDRCLLVSAPTSAGKTFISYYCMKRVLSQDDTSVVIYVAPTTALLNQVNLASLVVADVYARFNAKQDVYKQKQNLTATQSVWGILGGAYYNYHPFQCQILVATPGCLEQVLLSPLYQRWAQRIKYVIFDEIHCIDQMEEEGTIWERLISLVQCPFLTLSATMGNPDQFVGWLERAQEAVNLRQSESPALKVEQVVWQHRFTDLAKYFYVPPDVPADKTPQSLIPAKPTNQSALKSFNRNGMLHLHPLVCITAERLQDGFPSDIPFLPEESVELFDCMWAGLDSFMRGDGKSLQGEQAAYLDNAKRELECLAPEEYFKDCLCIRMGHAREYEAALKETLVGWAKRTESGVQNPLYTTVEQLLNRLTSNPMKQMDVAEKRQLQQCMEGKDFVKTHILDCLLTLKGQEKLPAIVFTFDEGRVEELGQQVVEQLEALEDQYKQTPEYKERVKSAKSKESKEKKDGKTREKLTKKEKEDQGLDHVEIYDSSLPEIEPDFAFVNRDTETISNDEFMELIKYPIRVYGEDHIYVRCLKRGIGIHHPDQKRKFAMIIERLFRAKYITVLFATEALALGIHTPCRTVVFGGDDLSLNTLQFRQMSGRAGRRGVDPQGHVVLFGVSQKKIDKLQNGHLGMLRGHNPLPLSLVHRLCVLHETAHGKLLPQNYKEAILPVSKLEDQTKEQRDAFKNVAKRHVNVLLNSFLMQTPEASRCQQELDALAPGCADEEKTKCKQSLKQARQLYSQQLRFFFIYSLQYLTSEGFIDDKLRAVAKSDAASGITPGWSAIASRSLRGWEPECYYLMSLLKSKELHDLFKDYKADSGANHMNEKDPVLMLLVTLCHLVSRVRMHPSVLQSEELQQKRLQLKMSMTLPPLPSGLAAVIQSHNQRALKCYSTYVRHFGAVVNGQLGPEDKLPLSGIAFPLDRDETMPTLPSGASAVEAEPSTSSGTPVAPSDTPAPSAAQPKAKQSEDDWENEVSDADDWENDVPDDDDAAGESWQDAVESGPEAPGQAKSQAVQGLPEGDKLVQSGLLNLLKAQSIKFSARSPFCALSGHGDDFTSVTDFTTGLRRGIHVDSNTFPVFDFDYHGQPTHLNALILDYFMRHNQKDAIYEVNGVDPGYMWKAMTHFFHVLDRLWQAMEMVSPKEKGKQCLCLDGLSKNKDADDIAVLKAKHTPAAQEFNELPNIVARGYIGVKDKAQ
eukprot:gene747-387_t